MTLLSVCFILVTCLYMAIVVYAPSLALAQVTGINMDLSIGLTFLVRGHSLMTSRLDSILFDLLSPLFLP